MKIEQSAILMTSGHTLTEQYSRSERLEAWVGAPPGDDRSQQGDRITVSRDVADRLSASISKTRKAYGIDHKEQSLDPKLSMLKRLIELFTGKRIKLTDLSMMDKGSSCDGPECDNQDAANSEAQPMEGWGVSYDMQESYAEAEQTTVSAQGIVLTSDGREIAFSLELNMERSYIEQTSVSVRMGDATRIDPLVINFDGAAAQLSDWTFSFDLNADGIEEEIPFVTSGSGILVFDRNGDNIVNDGTELFGPSTGNGFSELAALDEDNNMWIDENDAAFNLLSIWQRDQEGNESLVSLAESGIGAINVGYVDSPFDLTDQDNNLKGQILRTGVYLNETGMAGSVQQLDVVM